MKALERALKSDGLKVMILMRLSPIIPFIFVNYVLGVTSVTFADYAISTLFILPATMVYVFIGTTTGSIQDAALKKDGDMDTMKLFSLITGCFFALAATIYLSMKVREYLKQSMDQVSLPEEQQNEQSNAIN